MDFRFHDKLLDNNVIKRTISSDILYIKEGEVIVKEKRLPHLMLVKLILI